MNKLRMLLMNEEERIARFYQKHGVAPPSRDKHGTEDDIKASMQRLKPNEWYLEGNKLIGRTDMGILAQYIPPDYICVGTDDNGLPKLQKVVL